jgi:hypothetical protein
MVLGNKQYRTKNFTVTVEYHYDRNVDPDLKDFKWVRIYGNASTVNYCSDSRLLLGCSSGREPASVLFKNAKEKAVQLLASYKKRARRILELEI